MKYLRLKTSDPYLNLAVEEFLFRYTDDDIFMLWQNRPSVIIGKNQNAYAEVELDFARENGISVVRRITGGGAVYHDGGNVNYSFITSRERAEALDFAYFTRPIIDALGALGLKVELSGRNDLVCEDRKLSGNAQFSDGKRVLHHGTLLFDAELEKMSAVLKTNPEKMKFRAISSHKSRVANIRPLLEREMTVEEFILHLESHISGRTEGELAVFEGDQRLKELIDRNRSEEWIYSYKSYLREYSMRAERRFDFGTIAIELLLDGETVKKASVSGDFFDVGSVSELEAMMVGKTAEEICRIDPSPFVHNMTPEHLTALIKG